MTNEEFRERMQRMNRADERCDRECDRAMAAFWIGMALMLLMGLLTHDHHPDPDFKMIRQEECK